MADYREIIIKKYRGIAHLPDFLFGFTFPLRRKAVARLNLLPGRTVVEIGCSSGANFALLQGAVGEKGQVLGVDLSPDMVDQANKRIRVAGWDNVSVIEGAAEDIVLPHSFDGLLLFAMHDVLTSPQALENIFKYLKPGGRVVAAGPKLASKFPGKALNPLIRLAYKRFAVSQGDADIPWRILAGQVGNLQVEETTSGLLYLVHGSVGDFNPWGTRE